ncbi:DUF2304 family protein [Neorhodopirellula lusitana]|uniref:DUF2304 family protein n=1 Tax=Neorhodopirellula lusitana TaxID=445327 RepID=UPI00384C8127
MNTFQHIVLPVLCGVILLDIRGLRQRRGNLTLRIVRIVAWCVAFALIAQPTLTSELSRRLGIGRGTDLMVYIFMLVAPVVWFRMQAQTHSLQRQIIRLARIEATRTAITGDGYAESETEDLTND